jgi:limonene 1,2-monooxygenase
LTVGVKWINVSLGYFAMPLHPSGSDPVRTMEQDLGRLAFLEARRFEGAWIGEHFTARWENILCPVRTPSWRQR